MFSAGTWLLELIALFQYVSLIEQHLGPFPVRLAVVSPDATAAPELPTPEPAALSSPLSAAQSAYSAAIASLSLANDTLEAAKKDVEEKKAVLEKRRKKLERVLRQEKRREGCPSDPSDSQKRKITSPASSEKSGRRRKKKRRGDAKWARKEKAKE
ncbi:hypothetical protein JCM10213v2_008473 [Rhodosporidiobolus nylandii]